MMRKVLKWFGILIGVLLLVIVIAGVVLYVLGRNALNETFDGLTVAALTLPEEGAARDAALARGEHLAFAVSLCAECHGDDLGGKVFIDDAVFGSGDAPNLTSGQGGIGASYTTEDWVRAIRHGVRSDGSGLKLMPADKYYHLSDDDLAALIVYVQSVPPVDRSTEDLSLSIVGTIIGNFMELPAAKIDHDAERPVAPAAGVTAEYGEYLITIGACQDCHGDKLDGKVAPVMPPGPDLTQSSIGSWSEADFVNTIRMGINPAGDTLDPEEMPWDYYTRMTDEELRAIWAYLITLE